LDSSRDVSDPKVVAGKLYRMNQREGMVAVLAEDGSCSIFEIVDKEKRPAANDLLRWDAAHPETLCNLTREDSYQVRVQNHGVRAHHDELLRLLGYSPGRRAQIMESRRRSGEVE
jgi:hypothetical protein